MPEICIWQLQKATFACPPVSWLFFTLPITRRGYFMRIVKFSLRNFAYILIIISLFSCQLKDSSTKVHSFLLDEITITEIQQGYKNGTYSVRQIVQLYFDQIARIDQNGHKLNSIIIINPDALQIADFLVSRDVKMLVVACNTSSAVAIKNASLI